MNHLPLALVILDGFGTAPTLPDNAITSACTPTLDFLRATYPHTLLTASGNAVGLLDGQMGNSEVGHLTIGAGRTVAQPIVQIHEAIDDGSIYHLPKLKAAFDSIAQSGASLHLVGLLSDAGVHAHDKHLYAYLSIAQKAGIKQTFVHAILDGRDAPPRSAQIYLQRLEQWMQYHGYAHLASIQGRFYGMDRDHQWDRTEKSFTMLCAGTVQQLSWHEMLHEQYDQQVTDEFIPPTLLDASGIIKKGDAVLFFNFRPDRARQLTDCFVSPESVPFNPMSPRLSYFITPVTLNDGTLGHATDNLTKQVVLFDKPPLTHTLKEIISKHNLHILSIAETEKYAHVTYFLGGGHEEPFPHEQQMLIPSLGDKSYADNPAMSAPHITDAVFDSLKHSTHDVYFINYANADMVGHSGDLGATIKAVECLDTQLKKLYDAITQRGGTLIITADHGKAEQMKKDGQPHTAHTANPVPFIVARQDAPDITTLQTLADVAPYLLQLLQLPVPEEMCTHY